MVLSQDTSRASKSAAKNQADGMALLEWRVKLLQKELKYPISERDEQGSEFWYLRPGMDGDEAAETCPIAVGFLDELNTIDGKSVGKWLTQKDQQQRFYGHYVDRVNEQQPVMYLLLPSGETGQAAMVLPAEGGLKQRNLQSFDLESQAFRTRLNRLMEMSIAERALVLIPQVEYAFYEPIKTAKELAVLLAEAVRTIENVIWSDFQSKGNREDLVIRFYEDFLAAYNPGMREKRGVYYTPEPVVGYIVRSVDHILKTDFGLTDGLTDASKVAVEQADSSTKDVHKALITDIALETGVPPFFIDRCLINKQLVTALRQSGITVEIHDDHFAPNTADVDWLPQVGECGWVVLTKDGNIARRTLEKIAVTRANVKLFILANEQLASNEMIKILIKAIVPMQNFVQKYPAPFIAKIYRDSRLEMWRDREALLKELDNRRG
jgi:PIN like domain